MIIKDEQQELRYSHNYVGSVMAEDERIRPLKDPYMVVHYYYPIEELFNRVHQITSLIGKHRRDENGNNMLDIIALTEDERHIFDEFCLQASNEVYKKISPYMWNERQSYIYDDEVSPNMEFVNSVHYIINKPQWVKENSMQVTDKLIEESIVNYIIYKWFLICNQGEAELYYNEFNNKLTNLKVSLSEYHTMSVNSHPF